MRFDPTARGFYDIMSGGLVWPDEFPMRCEVNWEEYLPRYVFAYRAALTLGESRSEFHLWQQLTEHAPSWPGLRPERRGEDARRRLLAAKRRESRCLDQLERDSFG